MKISEILRHKGNLIHTLGRNQAVRAAAEKMQDHEIGSVVIVDDASGAPLGIVTQREMMMALHELGSAAPGHCLTGIMQRPAPTCSPADDVMAVAQRMTNQRLRHLLVMADGQMVGVISMGDLVAARLRSSLLEADVLRDMARARVLAA